MLTDFAVLCKRVNAFRYTLWFWIGECIIQCFFPVWGKEEGHFPTCFQSAPFPGFKNHEMTEATCRLMGLSQPKSTYVLVRASGWDDWNSFFRILWLLNAESFVKDFWLNSDLSKEKKPYIIHWSFIYIQLLFWQWGNQEICNSSNRAAFKVTDHLWTGCLNTTFFGCSYPWLDAALNKLRFVQSLTLIPWKKNSSQQIEIGVVTGALRYSDVTQFFKVCQVQIIYLPNLKKIVFKPIKNSQE